MSVRFHTLPLSDQPTFLVIAEVTITSQQIVEAVLGLAPTHPEYDLNGDAAIDAADVLALTTSRTD